MFSWHPDIWGFNVFTHPVVEMWQNIDYWPFYDPTTVLHMENAHILPVLTIPVFHVFIKNACWQKCAIRISQAFQSLTSQENSDFHYPVLATETAKTPNNSILIKTGKVVFAENSKVAVLPELVVIAGERNRHGKTRKWPFFTKLTTFSWKMTKITKIDHFFMKNDENHENHESPLVSSQTGTRTPVTVGITAKTRYSGFTAKNPVIVGFTTRSLYPDVPTPVPHGSAPITRAPSTTGPAASSSPLSPSQCL